MKIAFIQTQSMESPYGVGRSGPLARELVRSGHHVSVLALHPNIEAVEERKYEERGVHISYVAPMHVKKLGNLKSYYSPHKLIRVVLEATLKLSISALASGADIIHVCKPHPMNSLAGISAKQLRKSTLFVDCDDYEAASGRFSGKWQKKGVAFFEKHVPLKAKMVTTNTYFIRDKLIQWGVPEEKIIYLPNGVERDRFKSPDQNKIEKLRADLDLRGKKVVSFIGTMSLPSHPVNLLIDAFAEVVKINPEAVLLMVGGGEDLDNLHQQACRLGIEHKIRFIGRVSAEDVPDYYYLSHVSTDPVYDDDAARGRCPLKIFESWASGVPFVSADVGDRKLLMGNPAAGHLVDPGNVGSLAEAILKIILSPELAQTYSLRGFHQIREYYWDKLAQKLDEYYQTHMPDKQQNGSL